MIKENIKEYNKIISMEILILILQKLLNQNKEFKHFTQIMYLIIVMMHKDNLMF